MVSKRAVTHMLILMVIRSKDYNQVREFFVRKFYNLDQEFFLKRENLLSCRVIDSESQIRQERFQTQV